MMTYMGEEPKKEWICTCITDLVCCTAESNTKLYTNYTPQIKKNNNKKNK